MKPSKKIQKKLQRRLAGHTKILQELRSKSKSTSERAYKAPGSRNPRKQG